MKAANMSDMFEIRDRVSFHAQKCGNNSIIASATYAEPNGITAGNLFLVFISVSLSVKFESIQVADPGSFVNSRTAYVYHKLPRRIFLKSDMTELNVENCVDSVKFFIRKIVS